jgi:hypothetical protein
MFDGHVHDDDELDFVPILASLEIEEIQVIFIRIKRMKSKKNSVVSTKIYSSHEMLSRSLLFLRIWWYFILPTNT